MIRHTAARGASEVTGKVHSRVEQMGSCYTDVGSNLSSAPDESVAPLTFYCFLSEVDWFESLAVATLLGCSEH